MSALSGAVASAWREMMEHDARHLAVVPTAPVLKSGTGIFVAVAGPSGAGKDSLIAGARAAFANDERVVFARRVITRPADASEPYESATPLAFRLRAESGGFALWWSANGLDYGLPASLLDDFERGHVIVANVSRDMTSVIRGRFPRTLVVHVTASAQTLAARLEQRGREPADQREGRLARALLKDQAVEADIRIENDGALENSIVTFVSVLKSVLPA
ncbi:MAG: phosphonate metabolism protein/1,5-bisphosphokinase (PRPP-forming) PhnN [Bosea sp. (in: a-proteobacteria)]